MDEQQLNKTSAQDASSNDVSDAVGAVPAAKKNGFNPVVFPLLAVVFLAVVVLVFLLAKESPTLASDAQKFIYPIFSGILIGGLTVLWLWYQSMPNARFTAGEKAWFFPVMGGALTLVLASLAYVCMGMWPVGDKSAMIVDMHHQYAPMLSQLRDMLLNGGSALYSFEVGTGTSFIPLFAYYLASPLNFLLVMFPKAYLAEGILIITLIKMTLTGAFMTLCVQYIYKRRSFSAMIIGIMYALMMYMLAYSWDIMWLDCVMMLPLVIMGFERMMRTGKYLMYVLTLAYTLYANYYIGFMVCMFLVLYYIVFFFRAKRNGAQQGIGFARFAIGSALAGGLAAFILVPTFLSLSGTSAAGGSLPEFSTNFNVFELIGRGLYGVEPTIRSGNLPNIYCGVLAVIALPIFATMGSIPLRRRLAYLGLFGFMAISLVLNQLDLVWHGLHSPNDLPYRYSFLYSFAVLLIAYEVLYRIRDIKPLQVGASLFGIAVYLIVEEQFGTEGYSYASLYVSFALMAAYGIIMLLASQKKILVRSAYMLLLTIVTAELLFNAGSTLNQMNNNEHYTSHDSYLDNDVTKAVQATVDQMELIGDEAAGGDFYRIEFLPRRTTADTALFDYRGITNFASSASYDMTRFMGAMGYDVNGVNSQLYKSFVPTADSLIGIKYVALESNITDHPHLVNLNTEVSVGESKYYIYENPQALPLGFMTTEAVKDYRIEYYNPMLSQNDLYKAMTGTADDVLKCLQITSLNPEMATISGTSAFNFNTTGSSTAVFTATVEEKGNIYIHVDCRAAKSINVSAAGNSWGVTTYEPYIIDAGTLEAGTEVTITVTTEQSCAGNIYVASLNEQAFSNDIAMLTANSLKIRNFTDSKLEGSIHADKAGVMMTSIEFDEGWTVKVDGKKVNTFAVGDALLAIDLEAGDHEITFSFMPRGLVIGIGISVVSVAALLFVLDYIKRRDTGKGIFAKKSK